MSAELELGKALFKAGLRIDPAKIIGKNFLFCVGEESNRHIIMGTITGVHASFRVGFYSAHLSVSAPELYGEPIRELYHHNDEWVVKIGTGTAPRTYLLGELKILESA